MKWELHDVNFRSLWSENVVFRQLCTVFPNFVKALIDVLYIVALNSSNTSYFGPVSVDSDH